MYTRTICNSSYFCYIRIVLQGVSLPVHFYRLSDLIIIIRVFYYFCGSILFKWNMLNEPKECLWSRCYCKLNVRKSEHQTIYHLFQSCFHNSILPNIKMPHHHYSQDTSTNQFLNLCRDQSLPCLLWTWRTPNEWHTQEIQRKHNFEF